MSQGINSIAVYFVWIPVFLLKPGFISADRTYNDWAAGCQFLIVDEAKDVSRGDFWSAYETFKTRIDTSPATFRSNAKYGKTKDDTMWFNCLIFTNDADAMIILEDDRRIAVFSNPTSKRDDDYYMKLHTALDDDAEARRLYWYLMRRDVAQFNPAAPPMTAAKIQMIDASKSPIDEIYEHLIENMAGDVATRKQLTANVKRVAQIAWFRSDRALTTERGEANLAPNAVTETPRKERILRSDRHHARRNQSVTQIS